MAQAVCYLAAAPKSNAVYTAYNAVRKEIAASPSYDVPMHLRNAPTGMMKEQGFGGGYRYAHDEPDAYAAGENYLPEEIKDRVYYQPVNRGLEKKIGEKLRYLQELDDSARDKRYR
jgi:putative ATPase